MARPFETTFILFVDMLGFAALVEKEGDEINELSPIFTGAELYSPSPAESLLGYRFMNFHRCLNQARVRLQEMGAGTAIVFSDSAFFRIDSLENAIHLARMLMFELVTSETPARMGLARGTYRMLRFLTDSSAQVSFHMSQFLGTGVVRAYETERCGVPGLRILLHPDLEPLLDKDDLRIIPVKPSEIMRLNVRSEVNYLDVTDNHLGQDFDDCNQFDCLRWMKDLTDGPFQYHYIETFDAWNRMRAQLKRAPYPWEKFLDRDKYDYTHGIRERPSTDH
ncbi:MAG: hypothetical protein KJZ84_24910 [Bryobacteraceae bacterium]|nr:hypothetical protein [Bryobacteraceae bacterium]